MGAEMDLMVGMLFMAVLVNEEGRMTTQHFNTRKRICQVSRNDYMGIIT